MKLVSSPSVSSDQMKNLNRECNLQSKERGLDIFKVKKEEWTFLSDGLSIGRNYVDL